MKPLDLGELLSFLDFKLSPFKLDLVDQLKDSIMRVVEVDPFEVSVLMDINFNNLKREEDIVLLEFNTRISYPKMEDTIEDVLQEFGEKFSLDIEQDLTPGLAKITFFYPVVQLPESEEEPAEEVEEDLGDEDLLDELGSDEEPMDEGEPAEEPEAEEEPAEEMTERESEDLGDIEEELV